ncbi:hypothetical protein RHMOL_Rhmol05G0019700 [Rhododendron molle]|uniref:Uncharacterized protein n=1 Tax=Rhododendron molle TaxID=49168 RepID=A0ACC0NJF8_RHOML|nr:hypothetical protein RHMOL_Rhmol05G0019700 [Rhododendron molle]
MEDEIHRSFKMSESAGDCGSVTTAAGSFGEEEVEVYAKADDFINRFKQQLKLQRLEDSLLRCREILTRVSSR